MAVKDWWESFSPDDCLKISSWEDMVDYIQHSACTDFTIYSECTIGGQAFRFTNNGALSTLVGGADTGDALKIVSNETDTYPFIRLEGDDYIELKTTNDIYFYEQAEQMFKFSLDGSTSIIYGSDDTGDNLKISANNTDTYPFIKLFGNSDIDVCVPDGRIIYFVEGDREFFSFNSGANLSILAGGKVSGDDLYIRANSLDNCAAIELHGDGDIVSKIKAASGFEISTCSLETLWEVDSNPTDKHVDFHCLDAHNFVLELRTTDPSSPTCLGQIWFRTDLV